MARPAALARKLALAPILAGALLVVPLPSSADDVAPNQLGQRMSFGKATATPAGDPPDNAGPPAGAGSGRRIR